MVPNLSVLTAGPPPPNPVDLLMGPKLLQLLDKAASVGISHVIVDGPPILGIADSIVLGNQIQDTLFIVRAGQHAQGEHPRRAAPPAPVGHPPARRCPDVRSRRARCRAMGPITATATTGTAWPRCPPAAADRAAPMSAQQVARRRVIENALLDFHHTPGRHLVAFRQPAVLFDSLKDVLAMAGERSIEQDAPPPAAPLVQAAQFFVRTAMLAPRSDHYALLGLPRNADASAIKERYRVLMRLMHPDFAASANAAWPNDAATRVNQAYEILSTPDKRTAYDEQLAAPTTAAPAPAAKTSAREPKKASPALTQKTGAIDSRQVLRWLATAFGAAGGLALAATWLVGSQSDRDFLVQRAITKPARATTSVASHDGAVAPSSALAPSEPASAPAPDNSLANSIAHALPAILGAPAAEPASAPLAAAQVAATQTPERTASLAVSLRRFHPPRRHRCRCRCRNLLHRLSLRNLLLRPSYHGRPLRHRAFPHPPSRKSSRN